ncbi:YheC/YheD family protein [Oceanobacillus oncorhynchi]|uniref:YheC/YheD family protein n=1 Tax=Oceanobacillus oncorhynchi TaxID=545501 RepID=UPI0018687361|nr:YheC/YheD family protein [Oceanobacillus oncorhynchi]
MIGLFSSFNKPSYMAKFISLVAKAKGIDVIFFRVNDINQDKHQINGRILLDNNWVKVTTKIPKVIEVSGYCLKYKQELEYLSKHAFLTNDAKNKLSKDKFQKKLEEDSFFNKFVIPSKKCTSFNDLESFLSEYNTVILKPVSGQKGQGIYKVDRINDGEYEISHQQSKENLSLNALHDFYNENIMNSKVYLVQKYVTSTTPDGSPFDCRIHLEKDGNGEWAIPKIFVRIGLGQKVTSNISQGGGSSDADVFFKTYFKNNAERILEELKELGYKMGVKLEELREKELMSIGLDVGVDHEGKLYVFEVNSQPGTTRLRAEVAMLRTDYYKYLLENK